MPDVINDFDKIFDSAITNFSSPTLAEISEVDHENYTCKCIGLTKNREKTDVVYPEVPIPKFWASSTGGIFMAPSPETIVLLNFLDNDTNFPVIAAIMGSKHSEESKEDTIIITCGDTKLIIDDKIFLSAGGVNLGDLLKEMADKIADLKTTNIEPVKCPGYVAAPTTVNLTLDIGQQGEWKQLKSQKIEKLFK